METAVQSIIQFLLAHIFKRSQAKSLSARHLSQIQLKISFSVSTKHLV